MPGFLIESLLTTNSQKIFFSGFSVSFKSNSRRSLLSYLIIYFTTEILCVLSVFICAMFTCLCLFVCVCLIVCSVRRTEIELRYHPQIVYMGAFDTGSLTNKEPASKAQWSSCLCILRADIHASGTGSGFYVNTGNLNSGPPACITETLLSGPSP